MIIEYVKIRLRDWAIQKEMEKDYKAKLKAKKVVEKEEEFIISKRAIKI